MVELLDYGNRIEVSGADLKQLPEDMKQIPAQAIRFTIHQNVHETLNIDDILEVFVRKHVSFRSVFPCVFLILEIISV